METRFSKAYADALIAQRKRQVAKMCTSKSGYATRADAAKDDGRVYGCPFCFLWHRVET